MSLQLHIMFRWLWPVHFCAADAILGTLVNDPLLHYPLFSVPRDRLDVSAALTQAITRSTVAMLSLDSSKKVVFHERFALSDAH